MKKPLLPSRSWPPHSPSRAADPKPEILVFGAASLTESLQDLGKAYEAKTGDEGRVLLRRLERPRAPDPGRRSGRRVLLGRHGEDGCAREGGPRQGGGPARVPLEQPRGHGARRLDSSRSPTPKISRTSRRSPSRIPPPSRSASTRRSGSTGLGLWEKIEPKVVPTLDVRASLAAVESGGGSGRRRLPHRCRDREVRAGRVRRHERARDPLLARPASRPRRTRRAPRRSSPSSRGPTGRAEFKKRGFVVRARRSSGDRRRLLDPAADAARGGDRRRSLILPLGIYAAWHLARRGGAARTLARDRPVACRWCCRRRRSACCCSRPSARAGRSAGCSTAPASRSSSPGRPSSSRPRSCPFRCSSGRCAPPSRRSTRASSRWAARSAAGPVRGLPPRRPAAGVARDPRGHPARLLARARRVRRHDHDRRQHPRAHADDGARDLPAHPDRPGRRGDAAGGRHRRPRVRRRLDDRDPDAPPHEEDRGVIELDVTLPLPRFRLRVDGQPRGRHRRGPRPLGLGKDVAARGDRRAAPARHGADRARRRGRHGHGRGRVPAARETADRLRSAGRLPLSAPRRRGQRPLRDAAGNGAAALFDEVVAILEIAPLLARFPSDALGRRAPARGPGARDRDRAAAAAARRAAGRRGPGAEGPDPALPAARARPSADPVSLRHAQRRRGARRGATRRSCCARAP